MFITLKCNNDKLSIEQASASTARGTRPRHAACTECRVKKVRVLCYHVQTNNTKSNQLKCSGDRDGCTGCLSSNLECTYRPTSRENNGTVKRSRTNSHAQSPGVQTSPPSTGSKSPPMPRISTSSATGSTEPLSWPTQTFTSTEEAKGFLDTFWKGFTASLEQPVGKSACSIFPDPDHELFFDYASFPSSESFSVGYEPDVVKIYRR
jgi:hypothetical protein